MAQIRKVHDLVATVSKLEVDGWCKFEGDSLVCRDYSRVT